MALLLSVSPIRAQQSPANQQAAADQQPQPAIPKQQQPPPEGRPAAQQATGEQPASLPTKTREEIAAEQIKRQEHQRILGIFPTFNMTNVPDAVAMTPKQKFQLALKSALDPVTFAVAGVDAAVSQYNDDFPGYGQGAEGYFKRWGASYADTFDGDLLGNALFPVLLHQDPRYFRKGTGTIKSRLWYAAISTVRSRGDNGKWQPNYSNVLGNIAAGGIANLYYPSTDRGIGLTFQRAFTVTAEGAFGAVLIEFWPDILRHFRKK